MEKNKYIHSVIPIIFIIGLLGCSYQDSRMNIKSETVEIYLYSSKKYEKLLVRKFLNDSVFSDFLYEDYNKLISRDTFKRINRTWYYMDNKSFCEFFSEKSFEKREIKRKHYDCSGKDNNGYNMEIETYMPVKTDTMDGEKVYVYEKNYTGPRDSTLSNCYCCHVFFNPSIGFVCLEDENCTSFRIKKIDSVPKEWKLE